MGRQYDISEWVEFEVDGYADGNSNEADRVGKEYEFTSSKALEKAEKRFTKAANRVVEAWVAKYPNKARDLVESDDYESEADIAWNTWAHQVGHGVGFWENMSNADWASLEKALDSDKKLRAAGQALEDEMLSAEERSWSRSSNPRRYKNREEKWADRDPVASAALGSGVGGMVGGMVAGPFGAGVGGAAGGYLGSPEDRKKRGAIGGGVGGLLGGTLGAAVGGAVGARKADRKDNPKRIKQLKAKLLKE